MNARFGPFLCLTALIMLTLAVPASAQTVAPAFQQQMEVVPLASLPANPTQMAWGPDQRLYVMTTNGGVLSYAYNAQTGALSDMKAAVPTVSGIGIAFHGQSMYLTTYSNSSHSSALLKLTDTNGNGIWGETDAGELNVPIVTGIPTGDHTIDQLQIQGDTLYVGIGRRTVNGRSGPLTSGLLDDFGNYGFWSPGGNGNTWGDCAYGGTIAWIQNLDLVPDTPGAANTYASIIQTQTLIQNDASPYTTNDPGKLIVHSAGASNPFGLCFDLYGRLWFTNNFNRTATNGDGTSGFGYPEGTPGPDLSRSVHDQLFLAAPGADYGYADDNWRGKNPMMTPGSPGYNRVLSTTFDNSFNTGPYTLYDPANPSGRALKVACVGDSITLGAYASTSANSYPGVLSRLLGPKYQVQNFGVSGTTLLKNTTQPYWGTSAFSDSAAYAPDVVVIMLGTNDSTVQNWAYHNDFAADYASLLDYYASLPSHPRLFVCSPPPVVSAFPLGSSEGTVEAEIPLIQQVAAQKGATYIDVHDGIPSDPAYFVNDGVHPNDSGYSAIASTIYQGLTSANLSFPADGLGPSSSADGCAFFYSPHLPPSLLGNIFIARYTDAITEDPNGGVQHTLNYSDLVAVDTDTGHVQRVASGFIHPLAVLSDGGDRLLIADYGSNNGTIYALHTLSSTVPLTDVPPSVSLTAPTNSTAIIQGVNISVAASASDSDGVIANVAFYAGTRFIGLAAAAPYSINWTPPAAGVYSLTAVATDNQGAKTTSAPVSIIVKAPNMSPTVTLTAPANGASATVGSTVSLSAAASDSDGSIASVAFTANTVVVGTATTSPYTATWQPTIATTYLVRAIATDNGGLSAASVQPVFLTVTLPANLPGQVRFFPRPGFTGRMVGGRFQGSSDGVNYTDLYTVTATPLDGQWTAAPLSVDPSTFRYLRYLSPPGSYGDVAEVEFDTGSGTSAVKLIGTTFGSPGSFGNSGATFDKALDGSTTTFFDAAASDNNYAGIDRGAPAGTILPAGAPGQAYYFPRLGYAVRMVGGRFQGSSDGINYIDLYIIPSKPTEGQWTAVPLPVDPATFRYLRYLSPPGSYGNVAEVEFDTGSGTSAVKLTGTGFGSPGSYGSSGGTFDKALDGNSGTFFDAPTSDGNFTGIDRGAGVVTTPPVTLPNLPPTVAISAPMAGAAATKGVSTTVTATASDSDGTIAQVAFYAGTTLIGTTTAAPYSVSWTPTAAGPVSLTAVATDNLGATTTSAAVSIMVTTPNVPPAVSLTTPTNGSPATVGTPVSLTAVAADTDGTVAQVAFYVGTTLVGTDTTAPYSVSWTPAAAGSANLIAVATDNQGATTTSTAVSVTVTNPPAPSPGQVRYMPRASGYSARMVGGRFQGSNDGTNYTDLYTISSAPVNGQWTAAVLTRDPTTYRYLRYLSPPGSYGNVAEVEFDTGSGTSAVKLTGTGFGSPGSYGSSGATFDKALDGNGATFFDAPIPNGNYVGIDRGGATAVSPPVTTPNVPPTVSLTAPITGAAITTGVSVSLTATASDSDGTVAQVAFYAGTTLIGTTTAAPYSVSWTPTVAGPVSLTAVATDNLGATTTSTAISVTVAAPVVTPPVASPGQVRYMPRTGGYGTRMIGGRFQGSNDGVTYTDLYTISSLPVDGQLTSAPLTVDPAAYRYLRYLCPSGSYGNVAEVEFDTGAGTSAMKLSGTGFGSPGSYGNTGATFDKALDGNPATFFDGPTSDGNFTGIDRGSTTPVTPPAPAPGQVRYMPRAGGYGARMVGGRFQGSNDNVNYTDLYTVTATPLDGPWTAAPLSVDPAAFRYLRYLSPSGSYGNVAEVEFDTGSGTSAVKLTGVSFGSPGSYGNTGATFDKALDGNSATFFDAPGPNGNFAGIDRGATAPLH